MAKLIFGMNVSLDGYVDHDKFGPDPVLFRHFVERVRNLAGSIYGTRIYQIMQYWDESQTHWNEAEKEFAVAWRSQPKWVVSNSLKSVGPNATLLDGDLGNTVRELKASQVGTIEVAGPALAQSLTSLGLIDEYWLYLHPVVLGRGNPFFQAAAPPLRLVSSERIGPEVIKLSYVPRIAEA